MSRMYKIKRDIIIYIILKKKKTRHKIKYLCLFENFQCFWIFFNKKQPKKNKTTTNKNKTSPQIIDRIKLYGQVSNTHLGESFLTHLARVFGFVGENP